MHVISAGFFGIKVGRNKKLNFIVLHQHTVNRNIAEIVLKIRLFTLLYINQTMKRMSSECMSEYIRYINDTRASFDRLIEENSSKEREVFKKFASIAENSCAILESGIDKITKKAEKD